MKTWERIVLVAGVVAWANLAGAFVSELLILPVGLAGLCFLRWRYGE